MLEFNKQLYCHHCMAHRMNLVFSNSMKMFTSFHNVEKLANRLYKVCFLILSSFLLLIDILLILLKYFHLFQFYSVSHKRSNSLADFLKMENDANFHLSYVFDVRFVKTFHVWSSNSTMSK